MAGAESRANGHEPREYQIELLESAKEKNIIVCLGTGTGKTFISIKLIEHLAERDDIRQSFLEGAKRTFFLVNSVPLVFQQAKAIERHTSLTVKSFCGEMGVDFWSKDEWMEHFEENHVLVMTHQIYLDLLQHAKIKLSQANLLVFDECHHANKSHPFKKIMDRFVDFPEDDHPHILGLTASVVGKKVKPNSIQSEVRKLENTLRCVCETASDPNVVEKYGAKPQEIFRKYSSAHLNDVAKYLEGKFCLVLGDLHKFLHNVKLRKEEGGLQEVIEKELTVAKAAIRECDAALEEIGVWAAYEVAKMMICDLEKRRKRVLGSLSTQAHMGSLFLGVTLTSLREICGIYNEFKVANQCELELKQELLKPKVKKLLELFRRTDGTGDTNLCSIVFVERRYAACVLSKLINQLSEHDKEFNHLRSDFVTGHGADVKGISETEMKFNEQNKKLDGFRNGKFNVLVGTSVVEEGVDIPKCNLVVMFDFPKNYRGYVQSRGRGRAKDARYVLLVNKTDYEEKTQEQQMYQSIDEYLKTLCQRNRAQPTDEEANDAVNVDVLEPYFTNRNAKVDMGSSIGLLYRYCSKLPCDQFTQLKPKFTIHDVGVEFQAHLLMPRNSHLTHLIKGEPMPSKKEAKMAVALEACKQLHRLGELNDNLLPVDSSSDSEPEDLDETDGPKTGTKKRRRYHAVKVIQQLEGKLESNSNEEYYVYAIKMKVVGVFNSKKANTKKELWDRKEHLFGFVTKNTLPQLPNFPLFNAIGKVEIEIEHCLTLDNIEADQLCLINWFHEFIFTEELEFDVSSTDTGCRVVLLSFNNPSCQPWSTKPFYSPTEITEINFEDMRRLREKVKSCDGKITRETDLNDAMVIAMYRKNKARYLVTAVDRHSNPLSDFPDPSKGETFKDYYKTRYNKNIKDDSQPLIHVVHSSRKIDCRSTKAASDVSSRYDQERLVPELCTLMKCPQSVSLRVNLLPSIFYRLQSLLGMLELRNTISAEAGIGSSSSMNGHEESWLNEELSESPNKKSKLSISSDTMIYDSSCDQEDSSQEPPRRNRKVTRNLDRYFFPFDSSRSVSLVKLLEAFTCASSSDAFNLERLEMLGDSFLEMAVTIYAYCHMNHKDEGKLTNYRSRQISNKSLFNLARGKGLAAYLKHDVLSKGTWVPPGCKKSDTSKKSPRNGEVGMESTGDEDVSRQLIPDKSIADSVEALIGAHLIECGYMTALKFMEWLGLKVLAEEEEKSGVLNSSFYANYRTYVCDIPEDEDERSREILKRQTKEMASFEKKIGYVFKNKELLLEAFTHPSYSDNTITGSYQRLEFLGDAVLDFLVTLHIYDHCSDKLTPGKLTDLRSALVNNHTFASIAVDNGYHKYCKEYSPKLFSTIGDFVKALEEYQKETGTTVSPNPYVIAVPNENNGVECMEAPKPLGDIFESVAGAIFVDSGMDVRTVWKVCYRMLQKHIDTYSAKVPVDPVRAVMEFDSGAEFSNAKENEEGKISCDLIFTEERGKQIGQTIFTGTGRNKKNAKLSAASRAQKKIEQVN
uniref:Endoribonuclease dicer n=1 Tax=Calyptrophora lyra TaxID=2864141 RepID=A0A977XUP0_9CNID|nr:endoribonuclease dicer [Calyptrophora lyra]